MQQKSALIFKKSIDFFIRDNYLYNDFYFYSWIRGFVANKKCDFPLTVINFKVGDCVCNIIL